MKFIYELKNLIGINCQDIWIFRPSFWHSSQAYFVVVLFFKLFNSLVWATACDSLVNGYETGPCTKLTLQWTNYLLITPLKSSKKKVISLLTMSLITGTKHYRVGKQLAMSLSTMILTVELFDDLCLWKCTCSSFWKPICLDKQSLLSAEVVLEWRILQDNRLLCFFNVLQMLPWNLHLFGWEMIQGWVALYVIKLITMWWKL